MNLIVDNQNLPVPNCQVTPVRPIGHNGQTGLNFEVSHMAKLVLLLPVKIGQTGCFSRSGWSTLLASRVAGFANTLKGMFMIIDMFRCQHTFWKLH
jgi:hypothetical protein